MSRSNSVALAAGTDPATDPWTNAVLSFSDCQDRWRVVETGGAEEGGQGRPLRYRMRVTAGLAGGAAPARAATEIDVPGCARVCVHAASIVVDMQNRSGYAGRAFVGVGDGAVPTRNQLSEKLTGVGGSLVVPCGATHGRLLGLFNSVSAADYTVTLIDAYGSTVATAAAYDQPPEGFPLAGIAVLAVAIPSGGAPCIVVFDLSR